MQKVKGDLLKLAEQGYFNIIVHGANCFCTMGSGIAKQIRERYPAAYEVDKQTKSGDRDKLGTYTIMLGKRFNIVNAYTQYGFNRGGVNKDVFEYEAFQQILDDLADRYPHCQFGLPYIGMGLAAGNADIIIPMIERFAERVEKTGGTVTLVEFG